MPGDLVERLRERANVFYALGREHRVPESRRKAYAETVDTLREAADELVHLRAVVADVRLYLHNRIDAQAIIEHIDKSAALTGRTG